MERRAADSEIWHRLSSTIKLTTYKAVDLVKFKEYVFRVFAENQFGVGPPAEHPPIIARYPFGRSRDHRPVWAQCTIVAKPGLTCPPLLVLRHAWSSLQAGGFGHRQGLCDSGLVRA